MNDNKKVLEVIRKAKRGDVIFWNEATGEIRNLKKDVDYAVILLSHARKPKDNYGGKV